MKFSLFQWFLTLSIIGNLLQNLENPPTCGFAKFITCTMKIRYKASNCCKETHAVCTTVKVTENERRQQALLESQDLLQTYMNFRNPWNKLSSRLQSFRSPSVFHGPRFGNHWLIVFVCWNGFKLVWSERNINFVSI